MPTVPTVSPYIPVRVVAHLASDIANPRLPPALDGLLAFAQAVYLEQREPPKPGQMAPVDITEAVALSPCGRYHLCTAAIAEPELYRRGRFVNRRMPIAEAQALGDARVRSLNLSGGPAKSFRIPLETAWLKADRVTWYALGRVDAIRARLRWISYLGKRRAVGLGKVARWEVEPCPASDLWGDGFPIVRDGRPLRNLPLDVMEPEAGEPFVGYAVITYPYFERDREELCLVACPNVVPNDTVDTVDTYPVSPFTAVTAA